MSFIEPLLSTTEVGETKMQQYSGEHWEERLENEEKKVKSLHAEYYRKGSNLSLQVLIFTSFFMGGYLSKDYKDKLLDGLASMAILLLSLSNFVNSVIPVLGNRLFLSFGLFALAYLIRLYSKHNIRTNQHKWIVYLCLPAIALFIFTQWSINGDLLDFKVLFKKKLD